MRNIKAQKGYALYELIWLVLIVIAVGGYIANIVKFVRGFPYDDGIFLAVCRIVGIIVYPFGILLGLFV